MPDPYLSGAPWPAARGGLGNLARGREPRGGDPRRWALGRPVIASPLVGPGGVVHVATIDGRVWRLDATADEPRGISLGAPVVAAGCLDGAGGSLWPLLDGTVLSLRADDTVAWRYGLAVARTTPTLLPTRALRAPLVLGSDGTILAGSDDTHLYAIRPDGTLRWAAPLGLPVRGAPAVDVDGGVLVGGLDATVTRLDAASGRVRWRRAVGHGVIGGVATDGAGTAAVATMGGRAVGLDIARGRIVWTSSFEGPLVAPPACLGMTEGWVVATLDGSLALLSATGRSRARVEIGERIVRGPVVAGDAVVLATESGRVRVFDTASLEPRGTLAAGPGAVPSAVRGLGLGEQGVVVATTAGEVAVLPLDASSDEEPVPSGGTAIGDGPVRLSRLHLDEPALIGALDPAVGVSLEIDVAFVDLGAESVGLGQWRDRSEPGRAGWVIFDVDGRRLTTDRLPLRVSSVPLSLGATFDLPEAAGEATWTVELAPGFALPDPAAALVVAAHGSALVERSGKPFVAMRRVFEEVRAADLPTPAQLVSQIRGLGSAAPRWVAALSGLLSPSRWRGLTPEVRGRGRVAVAPLLPPTVSGMVDHVRFDASRRRVVAEVAGPDGDGLRAEDLLILLVRAGRRVDVDVVRQTSVTVRHDVVTDVVLELPLGLLVDPALEAWVFVGHRCVWRGALLGEAGPEGQGEPTD